MSQTPKLLLVGIFCFLLGVGALFSWSAYSETQRENAQLKAQLETTSGEESVQNGANEKKMAAASSAPDEKSDEKPVVAQTGTIAGTLGYPSQGIPPLEVFAINASDNSVYFKTVTAVNQQTFTIDGIAPGVYVVVAYPLDTDALAGGYTKAVACGLSVECTDHSLIQVAVTAGQSESGIEVKDWYAPSGQFPPRP